MSTQVTPKKRNTSTNQIPKGAWRTWMGTPTKRNSAKSRAHRAMACPRARLGWLGGIGWARGSVEAGSGTSGWSDTDLPGLGDDEEFINRRRNESFAPG